jgi:hypothetical protein
MGDFETGPASEEFLAAVGKRVPAWRPAQPPRQVVANAKGVLKNYPSVRKNYPST